MFWLRIWLALALCGAACSSGSLGSAPGAASGGVGRAPEPAVVPSLLDTGWGMVRLDAPALELQVPELSAWHASGSGKSWTRLEHRGSGSVLELWQVRAERRVRPADCEAKARLTRHDLWQPLPETTIDKQFLDAPASYRTELTVGIEAGQEHGVVSGFVIAFGAAASRCYALVFATRAQGKGAEPEIGRRLDLVAGRVFRSVAIRGVEDRVSPQPLP